MMWLLHNGEDYEDWTGLLDHARRSFVNWKYADKMLCLFGTSWWEVSHQDILSRNTSLLLEWRITVSYYFINIYCCRFGKKSVTQRTYGHATAFPVHETAVVALKRDVLATSIWTRNCFSLQETAVVDLKREVLATNISSRNYFSFKKLLS